MSRLGWNRLPGTRWSIVSFGTRLWEALIARKTAFARVAGIIPFLEVPRIFWL
jgi:hypothetical protein